MPVDREAMVAALQKIVVENHAQGKPLEVGLGRAVGFLVGSLARLLDAQERRIDQLEKRLDDGPFKYMGPHVEGTDYRKGDFVTLGGSLWHCNYQTRARPGEGFDWTLCVKRGRDARDLR